MISVCARDEEYFPEVPKVCSKRARATTSITDSDDLKGGSYKMKDVLRRGRTTTPA
jgi:hypothetical protein